MRWRAGLLVVLLLAGGCKFGAKRSDSPKQETQPRFDELFKSDARPTDAPRRPADPMTGSAGDSPAPVWPTEPPTSGPTLSLDMQTAPPTANGDVVVRINVVNRSSNPSTGVSVVQPVPETAQLIQSQPMASLKGAQLVWDLPPVAGNSSQFVTAVYRPARAGNLALKAELYGPMGRIADASTVAQSATPVANQMTAKPAAGSPALTLRVSGPSEAQPGETVSYEVQLGNVGSSVAKNVLLSAEMDPGLDHESGSRKLEIPLPQLAAGDTKSVQLPLSVHGSGRLRTVFRLRGDGCSPATEERFVDVHQGELDFSMTGPPRPLFGQPATWNLRVYNPGESAVNNVVVRVQMPAELQYQSASSDGQLIAGQVVWQIRRLGAKEPMTVQFTAVGRQLTPRTTLIAAAHADRVDEKRSQLPLEILGTPHLQVRLKAASDTAPVGSGVIYTVDVTNDGSLTLTDVDLLGTVPSPLRPLFGSGPTLVTVERNQVVFGRLLRLEPGRSATFRFEAEALQSGDARVRVEAKCPALPGPVIQEEATRIVPAR